MGASRSHHGRRTVSAPSLAAPFGEFNNVIFSGKLLLCVLPGAGPESLHSVKWHPRQSNVIAISSETGIFLFDIFHASRMFGGEPIDHNDLYRLAQPFAVPSVSTYFV